MKPRPVDHRGKGNIFDTYVNQVEIFQVREINLRYTRGYPLHGDSYRISEMLSRHRGYRAYMATTCPRTFRRRVRYRHQASSGFPKLLQAQLTGRGVGCNQNSDLSSPDQVIYRCSCHRVMRVGFSHTRNVTMCNIDVARPNQMHIFHKMAGWRSSPTTRGIMDPCGASNRQANDMAYR